MPSIAVVILNYNGKHHLQKFLPSVLSSVYLGVEIWVADNGSTDDSIAFLQEKYPTIRLIQLPENYGFAEGYNQALQQVEADYYVLLNSDVETPEGWIQPIVDMMENDATIAAAQPKILDYADKHLFEHAGAAGGWMDNLGYPFCRGRILFHREVDEGQYDEVQEIFWASGAAMFVRAKLYHEAGGLDGDFFAHMEEIDLCWRLKRLGYKVVAQPKSIVYHVGGGTLDAENPRKTYLNFRNSLVTLVKNESTGRLFGLILMRLILDGVAGVRFLTEGKFRHIWAILRAHFYFYFSIFKTIKKRRNIRRMIQQKSIGKANTEGIYRGSIVWSFFIKKRKTFVKMVDGERRTTDGERQTMDDRR